MKKMKYWKEIIGAVLIIGINIYIFKFAGKKNTQFWDFNFLSVVTLDFAAMISFYVVQKISSSRRKNDFIVRSLYEIEDLLAQDKLRDISSDKALKTARLCQRTISNRLEIIKKKSPRCIKKDIEKATNSFNEYKELFDNNSSRQDLLDGQKQDFERLEAVLGDVFFDMKMKIYDEIL